LLTIYFRCIKFYFLLFLFQVIVSHPQVTPKKPVKRFKSIDFESQERETDSTKFKNETNVILRGKTNFSNYKIISYNRDTTYIVTTSNINKDHLLNYLRKDNFELLPFHNQEQTFNLLGYDFSDATLRPKIEATAKNYNFYEVGKQINTIKISSLILQPFLENAIWHGLSLKEGMKKLEIKIEKENRKYIQIHIIDNGIGRKRAAEIIEKKIHKRDSIGIKLIEERLKYFAQEYQSKCDLGFTDLEDNNSNTTGTRVTLRLPIV